MRMVGQLQVQVELVEVSVQEIRKSFEPSVVALQTFHASTETCIIANRGYAAVFRWTAMADPSAWHSASGVPHSGVIF